MIESNLTPEKTKKPLVDPTPVPSKVEDLTEREIQERILVNIRKTEKHTANILDWVQFLGWLTIVGAVITGILIASASR